MKGLIFSIALLSATVSPATTYESVRAEAAQEANNRIDALNYSFLRIYKPAVFKLGLSSFLTGILIPLTVQTIKADNTKLACLYSACATLCGYFTILQHAELMEDRRFLNQEIANADQTYEDRMAHIHTHHYMNDIAKFMMAGFEELAEKYCSPAKEDSEMANPQA